MMPLSFLDFFSDFDATQWILFGALVVAFVGYYFWPESSDQAHSEVSVDQATRQQAKPMVAPASGEVDTALFDLKPMPLQIHAAARLKAGAAAADAVNPLEVREALWAQQRAMISRLESELDYAQQADVSDHFAIAAPANQPASLLENTLKELESRLEQTRELLKLPADRPLWHGRALILMLSNRKLFDHVAWLTGAGLAASAPGAFTQAAEDVVVIGLYATRLGGFARQLTFQIARAAVCCTGGERTPKWVEYGLANWIAEKILGKQEKQADEQAVQWELEASPAIFDPKAWQSAADDSSRLEQLVAWSQVHVEEVMAEQSDSLVSKLQELRAGDADPSSLFQIFCARGS